MLFFIFCLFFVSIFRKSQYIIHEKSTLRLNLKLDKIIAKFKVKQLPELVLIANSDAGKLNARNVFYRYVNVSVTLIINDDSLGDLIDE